MQHLYEHDVVERSPVCFVVEPDFDSPAAVLTNHCHEGLRGEDHLAEPKP